jgi:hypothetical protein
VVVNDGDVLEVTVAHDNGTSGEQLNRLQFILGTPAPVDEADVLDDISEMVQALYNLVKSIISLRNILREVKVFNVTQDRLMGATDAGTYEGGTAADPALPRGNALYLHFVTNVPRVILSKYLPSPSQSQVGAGGLLTPAVTEDLVAYGTVLLNEQFFGTRGYKYGYLSPKVMEFVLPEVLVVRDVMAYQRRRKSGSGS